MRALSVLLIVLSSVCGCGKRLDTSTYPKLVLDEQHHVASDRPAWYQVPPCTGIVLDSGLLDHASLNPEPNMVQVIIQRPRRNISYTFYGRPRSNLFVLDRNTLDQAWGRPVFHGFSTGDKLQVVVGVSYPRGGSTQPEFANVLFSGFAQVE